MVIVIVLPLAQLFVKQVNVVGDAVLVERRILRAVGRAPECIPFARGPLVPASVTEPVSGLAPTADRVHARRSVILSSHVAASIEAL